MLNDLIAPQFDTINLERDKTTFLPGGEWLYFNIYCNQNCIDNVIIDVTNLVNEFNGSLSYFFTRYNDINGHHLRIRIRNYDVKIIASMNKFFIHSPYIMSINIDTYQREVTRYGYPTILSVEDLFCIDSKLVSNLLSQGKLENDIDRIAFCVFNLNHYLDCFSFTQSEKLSYIQIAKNDFFDEFNIDELTKKGMNKLYQKYFKGNIDEMILPLYESNIIFFKERSKICKNIINNYKFDNKYTDFVWSILHMFSNKVFSSEYRYYEMISYDYFYKLLMEHIYSKKVH